MRNVSGWFSAGVIRGASLSKMKDLVSGSPRLPAPSIGITVSVFSPCSGTPRRLVVVQKMISTQLSVVLPVAAVGLLAVLFVPVTESGIDTAALPVLMQACSAPPFQMHR